MPTISLLEFLSVMTSTDLDLWMACSWGCVRERGGETEPAGLGGRGGLFSVCEREGRERGGEREGGERERGGESQFSHTHICTLTLIHIGTHTHTHRHTGTHSPPN